MTRIEGSGLVSGEAYQWILKNQQQISAHTAWYGNITEKESVKLLGDASPYTFILRGGDKEHSYFISFMKKDGSIKHQNFTLELDRKGWFYKNGITDGLLEAVARDIVDLIPLMMHCESSVCTPYSNDLK